MTTLKITCDRTVPRDPASRITNAVNDILTELSEIGVNPCNGSFVTSTPGDPNWVTVTWKNS